MYVSLLLRMSFLVVDERFFVFFFFQAEDGIRDVAVTRVQTCALPISSLKRLAIEVEDHPIEYNAFEGTIPAGQYGGGTVMVWDRGTYTYGGLEAGDPVDRLRAGYEKGDFKFFIQGERLRGSWVLVRTRRQESGKAQWLLIKHRDEYADERDVTEEYVTSVTTDRSFEEIAETG